jgi:hypothetical protein
VEGEWWQQRREPQIHHANTELNNCKEKEVALVVWPAQYLDTFEAALYTFIQHTKLGITEMQGLRKQTP